MIKESDTDVLLKEERDAILPEIRNYKKQPDKGINKENTRGHRKINSMKFDQSSSHNILQPFKTYTNVRPIENKKNFDAS